MTFAGVQVRVFNLMALLGSQGLVGGDLMFYLRAGGGLGPSLLVRGRMVDGLLLDVHWHGNMDWLLDDDLLIDRDMDGDGVGSGHVNDLRDWDGVGLRHFHGVWDADGLRNGDVLEDGDGVVSDDRNGDAHGFGDGDRDGLRNGNGLGDGNDLLDGLIDGDFDGDVEGSWDGYDFGDGDDFGHVNDFGDWHVLRDVHHLVNDLNYRGLVMVVPVAVAITPVHRGEGAQEDY